MVEFLGGSVVEVPLSAVLRVKLAAVGDDLVARAAVRDRYVEPPLEWSLSREVRKGMDDTLNGQKGGLEAESHHLVIALGLESGSVSPCNPL